MEMTRLLEDYGCLTFSDDVMKERIPKSIYKEFHASLDKGEELSKECATVIALSLIHICASIIKAKLEEYLENNRDDDIESSIVDNNIYELNSIVNGVVKELSDSKDEMVAKKLLGDGLIILPEDNIIRSPCKGKITMIFPTKHAIGITLENNLELLIHFGINTVALNGKGFELFVENNQDVMPGDILWKVDLDYIKANAVSEEIMIIVINASKDTEFVKLYGYKEQGELIGFIKKEER